MSKHPVLLGLTLGLTLLLCLKAGQAETEIPRDIKKFESAGLYANRKDGGLGRDLWDRSHRSTVRDYLQAMPNASEHPALQRLTLSLLLSAADISEMDNDIPLTAGEDFLTLRLEKLLDMGAYKKAYELYSFLPEKPYHPRIAKAGILSMLYSGEKSLACLENNTLQDLYEEDDFWRDLGAYCTYTLSETPDEKAESVLKETKHDVLRTLAFNKSYAFTYTAKSFDRLSPLEKALLTAESKLDIKTLNNTTILKIPAHHIEPLLAQENLSDKQRVALNIQAVKYGFKTTEDLEKIYEITKPPSRGEKVEQWEKLLSLYQDARNTKDSEEKWTFIRQSFPILKIYGATSLTPFARMLSQNAPKAASLDELKTVYTLFNAAGFEIPARWIDLLYTHRAVSEKNRLFFALANITHISNSSKFSKEFSDIIKSSNEEPAVFIEKITTITENIDKTPSQIDNAGGIYEKEFHLTSLKRYVMPSLQVWDRFVKAGKNRSLSETVLLSTVILRNEPLDEFYPGVFRDVITNFNNVGLTDVSKNIAIEAILGSI